jgi:hypothetical protein
MKKHSVVSRVRLLAELHEIVQKLVLADLVVVVLVQLFHKSLALTLALGWVALFP